MPHCGNGVPPRTNRRSVLRCLGLALQLLMAVHFLSIRAAAGEDAEKPKLPAPEAVAQLVREVEELRARVTDLETTLSAVRATAQPAADLPDAVRATGPNAADRSADYPRNLLRHPRRLHPSHAPPCQYLRTIVALTRQRE
jgi:hypothetical protein